MQQRLLDLVDVTLNTSYEPEDSVEDNLPLSLAYKIHEDCYKIIKKGT